MQYYDEEEKRKLTGLEFFVLMIICAILCIVGYIIGKILLAMISGG